MNQAHLGRAVCIGLASLLVIACSGSDDVEDEGGVSEEPIATNDSALIFHTPLIAEVSRCNWNVWNYCPDADGDGLNDVWEDAVLAHFEPRIEFDEQEKGLTDSRFHPGVAGRVIARKEDSTHIVVFFGLVYGEDYGSCSFTDHHGDVERAVLELERVGGTVGDLKWTKSFTSAHEGDPTDQSRLLQAPKDDLSKSLEFVNESTGPRWLVYASRNKHGTYVSKGSCESRKYLICLADYCGGDGSKSRNDYRRLFPILNAGEPTKPRDSSWASFGFPGADAWSDKKFCGVDTSGDCDEAPRGSLIHDPFSKKDI